MPWQRVIKANDTGTSPYPQEAHLPVSLISDVVLIDFDFVVNNNTLLNATWNRFETPIVQHTTIDSDGYGEVPPSPPPSPSYQPMSSH